MAKRGKRIRHRVRRGARKIGAAMETRPGKVLVMAVEATLGGVVTSMAVNKFSPASASPTMKAGIQGALGMAAVMFVRNKHVKAAGAGAVIASLMGLAQSVFKVSALSGPSMSRTLSPSELQRLIAGGGSSGMNLPLNRGMNLPLQGAGAIPSGSGFTGGFGSK